MSLAIQYYFWNKNVISIFYNNFDIGPDIFFLTKLMCKDSYRNREGFDY